MLLPTPFPAGLPRPPAAGPDSRGAAHRRHLEALVQEAPACLASLSGPDHVVTVANQLFRQLFGERALAGLPLREALPELQDQPFFTLLDEAYATGDICHSPREMLFRDATAGAPHGPVHFTFIAQAVRKSPNGAVTGLLLFAYDVSAHVRHQGHVGAHNLAPSATDQQLAVANAQLAVANAELSAINEELSVTNAELDATIDQLTESNQHLARANANLTTANADIQAHAGELHRGQKALRLLNQRLEARVGERTSQLQAALRESERANAALNESNASLTRTNADLDSFVHAASHDLKLPVLNLGGLIGELRRGITFADPAEEGVLMPLIEKTLRQLTATLDDLAVLGQVQHAAPAEAVALAEVVEDVAQVLEPQVRAARARLTVDFTARPVVHYPRATLRTIVLNLLSNALKYADPGRPCRVHVSLWLDDGQPVLWVQDNGLGFDAEAHRAELCQLFRRFHDHTEGTGVGLYLVNRLVQANGGRIEVDSRPDEGATFRVYLGQAPLPTPFG